MIDIYKLQKVADRAMEIGADKEQLFSAEEVISVFARLRQAEKDAARYRWLKEVARHDYDIDDFFDGSCDRIDAKVDECIEAMQCK